MAKTLSVYYERTFNLGNYESEKIGIELSVEEEEKAGDVLQKAKEFVESKSSKINIKK